MEHTQLGKTGLKVSKLGLGTMNFGSRVAKDTAFQILDKARDLGINLLDTANAYGRSEQILGEWFEKTGNRDEMIVSSKVGWPRGEGVNDRGLSTQHIVREITHSLDTLQTDYLDIYQPHYYDGDEDLEYLVALFSGFVDKGQVRIIGAPLFTIPIYVQKWHYLSRQGGFHNIQTKLMTTSLVSRGMEMGNTIVLAQDLDLGLITFGTLGGGLLTGKYRKDENFPQDGKEMFKDIVKKGQVEPILDIMDEISSNQGISMAQVALAWVLQKNFMDCIIVGASNPSQLDDMVEVIDLSLEDNEVKQLSGVSDNHYIW